MLSRASFRSVLALSVLALPGCMDDENAVEVPKPEPPSLREAAERTMAAGPARITATVRAGRVRYRLSGRWDPTRGYRVCVRIEDGPSPAYLERRVLWLEGRHWAYGTLLGHTCGRDRSWFDDHPPTLPLFDIKRLPAGGRTGAEDYLHAALLALGGMSDRALIDFREFDRDPPRRDEDGWTLRPLLRELGIRRVHVRVGRDGFVERLRLTAPGGSRRSPGPAEVVLRLEGFGDEPRVPRAVAYAIE